MKNYLFVFALVTGISIVGCKKDKGETALHYFLTATTNNSEEFRTSGQTAGATGGDGYLHIKAITPGGMPEVSLSCASYHGAGVYSFDKDISNAVYINALGDIHKSVSGTITISSAAPDIIGSYSFVCADGFTVSGSFNTNSVPY